MDSSFESSARHLIFWLFIDQNVMSASGCIK